MSAFASWLGKPAVNAVILVTLEKYRNLSVYRESVYVSVSAKGGTTLAICHEPAPIAGNHPAPPFYRRLDK